jgi:hypothetical protein
VLTEFCAWSRVQLMQPVAMSSIQMIGDRGMYINTDRDHGDILVAVMSGFRHLYRNGCNIKGCVHPCVN